MDFLGRQSESDNAQHECVSKYTPHKHTSSGAFLFFVKYRPETNLLQSAAERKTEEARTFIHV
jgi:hypothetical protein